MIVAGKKSSIIIGVFIAVAGAAVMYSVRGTKTSHIATSNRGYYSADDGATMFEASFDAPPYKAPDGRPAVAVRAFSYDGGATKVVGYLIRAAAQGAPSQPNHFPGASSESLVEVKKPGPNNPWIPEPPPDTPPDSPAMIAYQDVIHPPAKPGQGQPIPVFPPQESQ
jgi:hypothetical protein